jgi:hypothetical protein
MRTGPVAAWLLEQECRALLARLGLVRPFALHETMLPAASLHPAAQVAIENFLLAGRRELRGRIWDYLGWLRNGGRNAQPAELQRRFTAVRWRFNDLLSQFDLFQQAITQRSESGIGVWLSGLDVAAADALAVSGQPFEPPSIICYLERGPGAAIRRARTRLPGGDRSPVALVRIPRERIVGHGIASSLVHEVGHQAAALLGLVESLTLELNRVGPRSAPRRVAWAFWTRWISEVVADLWSVGKLGISSTLGLVGVVSLPRVFVFRLNVDDPHPFPWIRVQLSCAIGNALYPHRQWAELASLWSELYPLPPLDDQRRRLIADLTATMPHFVNVLVNHRPPALGGRSLRSVLPLSTRTPDRLATHYRSWAARPELIRDVAPTLAFAVLGQARIAGALAPEDESRIIGDLLTNWALRSTLDIAQLAATARPGQPSPITAGVPIRMPAALTQPTIRK